MTQFYTDPAREAEPHALPDAEVFYRTLVENVSDGWLEGDDFAADTEIRPAGWYWWSCFPGCTPDSDAFGPFDSEALAIADGQNDNGDSDKGDDGPKGFDPLVDGCELAGERHTPYADLARDIE